MERIKEDRPITIKDDKGNLNRCIADVVSVRALCACPEPPRGSTGRGLGGRRQLAWASAWGTGRRGRRARPGGRTGGSAGGPG